MAQRFGLAHLSSGDVLRKEIADGSPIGRQAHGFVSAGALVPDQVIIGVMLSGISKLPGGQGLILDGFPRTVPQAEALAAGLDGGGRPIDAVVDLQMNDDGIVERIVSRRICSKCGATYNVRFFPPRLAGRCDLDGEPLIQRVDDREDVVRARLETYRRQTAPLVAFYASRGLLRSVDASREADAVESDVVRIIEGLSKSA
jgi:adenylate kinase